MKIAPQPLAAHSAGKQQMCRRRDDRQGHLVMLRLDVPGKLAERGILVGDLLGGLTVGSPTAGAIADRWGTYQPVWAAALVLSLASAALIAPRARGGSRPA